MPSPSVTVLVADRREHRRNILQRTPQLKLCKRYRRDSNTDYISVGLISNQVRYPYSTIPYPLIKPPCKSCTLFASFTSGDFPELSAYYFLTPVASISGKSFLQVSASRLHILLGGKCERYESNIPQQLYKNCPITAWVLSPTALTAVSALFF